jgi:hypothetical protein
MGAGYKKIITSLGREYSLVIKIILKLGMGHSGI